MQHAPSLPALQFYYLFGFLALVFLILIITCAEITIVLCYFQLCSEVSSRRVQQGGDVQRRTSLQPACGRLQSGGVYIPLRCVRPSLHLQCWQPRY